MPDTTSSPGSVTGRRMAWADTAKALAIVLVVLHHTVTKHFDLLVPDTLSGVETAWLGVTHALKIVRMPLFFLVSGLLAGPALARPWRDVAGKRVLNVYFLYAVWLVIHMGVFMVLVDLPMNRVRGGTELAADLVLASSGLWYLYALVAYFLIARLVTSADPRIVVGVAAAVSLAAPALGIDAVNRESLLQHFVYFAFGAFFPRVVGGMARLDRRDTTLLAGATAGAFTAHLAITVGGETTRFVVSVLAVPLAVRGAAALAQWSPAASVGSFLGARTLPIYVLHVPLLAVVHVLLVDIVSFEGTGPTSVMAVALYPLLITVVVVLGCVVVQHALTRVGFAWLFAPPFGQPRSTLARQPEAVPSTAARAPSAS